MARLYASLSTATVNVFRVAAEKIERGDVVDERAIGTLFHDRPCQADRERFIAGLQVTVIKEHIMSPIEEAKPSDRRQAALDSAGSSPDRKLLSHGLKIIDPYQFDSCSH